MADLLGIGLLGSVQNLVASAVLRSPSALGFHLELVETIRENSLSEVLKTVEIKYPSVGASLMPIFFPNFSSSMRVASPDVPFWQQVNKRRHQQNRHGTMVDHIPWDVAPAIEQEGGKDLWMQNS